MFVLVCVLGLRPSENPGTIASHRITPYGIASYSIVLYRTAPASTHATECCYGIVSVASPPPEQQPQAHGRHLTLDRPCHLLAACYVQLATSLLPNRGFRLSATILCTC